MSKSYRNVNKKLILLLSKKGHCNFWRIKTKKLVKYKRHARDNYKKKNKNNVRLDQKLLKTGKNRYLSKKRRKRIKISHLDIVRISH
jgi:flagellar basal body rod protein FlgB